MNPHRLIIAALILSCLAIGAVAELLAWQNHELLRLIHTADQQAIKASSIGHKHNIASEHKTNRVEACIVLLRGGDKVEAVNIGNGQWVEIARFTPSKP